MASKGFSVSVCNRSHDKVRPSRPRCLAWCVCCVLHAFLCDVSIDLTLSYSVGFALPTTTQVDTTVQRAQAEGDLPLKGYKDVSTCRRVMHE